MADRKHENETFGPEALLIDGRIFVNCRFNGTKLIYTGDADVSFNGCVLTNVQFQFQGSADRTLRLLQAFYASDQSRPMVESVLEKIRASARPNVPVSGPGGSWQA